MTRTAQFVDTKSRTLYDNMEILVQFMADDGYVAQMHTLKVEPWEHDHILYTMSGELP